eukprot:Opistho-2@64784
MAAVGTEELPEEVVASIRAFEESVSTLESNLKPLLEAPLHEMRSKLEDPVDRAKFELTLAYAMNSLFWMYLNTQGVSPADHPVKQELERIRGYMKKVKDLSETKKFSNSRVNKDAASRFVRSALWDLKAKEAAKKGGALETLDDSADAMQVDDPADEEPVARTPSPAKATKRKEHPQSDSKTNHSNKKKKTRDGK